MSNKLEDHIDTPIKKCVAGLAIMGFKPIFSCCGFSYKDEAVKKSHLPRKSYIYIDIKDTSLLIKGVLLDIAYQSQWGIGFVGENSVELKYEGWNDNHPWAAKDSPHQAEMNVIAINRLERVLAEKLKTGMEVEENSNFLTRTVSLVDGNRIWKENGGLKYWQYEPCENWEFNLETFFNL